MPHGNNKTYYLNVFIVGSAYLPVWSFHDSPPERFYLALIFQEYAVCTDLPQPFRVLDIRGSEWEKMIQKQAQNTTNSLV